MDHFKYLYVNGDQVSTIDLDLVQHYFLQCRKYTSSVIEAIDRVQKEKVEFSPQFVDELHVHWNDLTYYREQIDELKTEHPRLILLDSLSRFSELTVQYAQYHYTSSIHILTNNWDEAEAYSKKANDIIPILNTVHTKFTHLYNQIVN